MVLCVLLFSGMFGVAYGDVQKGVDVLVKSNSMFAVELYRRVVQHGGNIFFSPFSVSEALAMTYAGAGGDTKRQMASVLHFDALGGYLHAAFSSLQSKVSADGRKKCKIYIANAMWGQEGFGFLSSFKELVDKYYGGAFFTVDYREHLQEAMKRINKWVSEKTNGKVARIIRKGDIDRLVRLVLTDAIYFKGLWNFQFDKECTKEQEFHALGGKSVKVQMMSQRGRFLYYEDKIIQAVALPYAGMHFSMLILLPKPEVNIKVLEDRLSLEYLQSIREEMSREIVRLSLPKFKLDERYYLKDVLYSMGMKDAFTKRADFSGMTGNKRLKISKVIHQAHVNVNEFGTEAAAATAVVMKLKAATPIGKVFRFDANRPFVFMVIHNPTGSILFIGRLTNPS